MGKNVKNKIYYIREAVSYYVLGYKRYEQNIKQNGIGDILKNIIEVAKENLNSTEISGIDTELLSRINFNWLINSNDFMAYAVCVFNSLLNSEIQITPEKIVRQFLKEIHSHHPRNVLKEAENILEESFPELKENTNK